MEPFNADCPLLSPQWRAPGAFNPGPHNLELVQVGAETPGTVYKTSSTAVRASIREQALLRSGNGFEYKDRSHEWGHGSIPEGPMAFAVSGIGLCVKEGNQNAIASTVSPESVPKRRHWGMHDAV